MLGGGRWDVGMLLVTFSDVHTCDKRTPGSGFSHHFPSKLRPVVGMAQMYSNVLKPETLSMFNMF